MAVDLTPIQLEAIEKETRAFRCPACDAHLQFRARLLIIGVQEPLSPEEVSIKDGLTKLSEKPKPNELVVQAKRDGIFSAFAKTAQVAMCNNMPQDLERYFVTWLTRATKIRSPQFAIRLCLPEDERSGDLELWAFNTMAGVVKDGYLRTFLPYQLVQGREVPGTLKPSGNGIQRVPTEMTLTRWIKTRNGYVTGYMLFNELRGKAAGAFANTGL